MKGMANKADNTFQKCIVAIAEKMVKKADEHVCFYIFHQPQMPDEVSLILKGKNGKNS